MRAHINSGIPGVGPIEWGTHFCQFYETADDLADTLVPYFKAGLDSNEKCLWVTAEPYGVDAATAGLRNAVPDFDRRVAHGDIEIYNHRDWYTRSGSMTANEVIDSWLGYTSRALDSGYSGLRLTGNLYWLRSEDWDTFIDYESRLNHAFCGHNLVALCSYCLGKTGATGVLDVVRNHQFAVVRRAGEWTFLESASLKAAKAELSLLNEQLEERVAEQTAALREELAHREVLFREVHHRVKNNLQVVTSLLAVKARQFRDPAVVQAFNDSLARVRSMSLVHEALYARGDTQRLDFADYLGGLCNELNSAYGAGERVSVEVLSEHKFLDLNQAVPLGLIATELVSNALKHAYKDGQSGRIVLSFSNVSGKGELTVENDGVELPEDAFERAQRGAGLSLIRSLAGQLGGSVELERGEGTRLRVEFPTS
jgi:two-component sensor histidine kinase